MLEASSSGQMPPCPTAVGLKRRKNNKKVGEHVEKWEPSCFAAGNIKQKTVW